tara:strand:+ start:1047 stop:2891 length:1845 start_codon:yes stop_codon:yes gene_type:complete
MKLSFLIYLLFLLFFLGCDNLNMDSPGFLDETPPVVHITYPANQSVVSGSVLVTAYAFDNNKLENVKLYLDDAVIFQGETEPYEVVWNTLQFQEEESYTISATAEDSSGNKTFSKSIEVQIDNYDNIKPNGIFLYPSTGQVLNGIVEISIHAEDNEQVDFIDLFINSDRIGSFDENPNIDEYYYYYWDTNDFLEDNINTIHAHIYDLSGNYKILGPISITVDNENAPDITFPQGTIIYPAAGSTVHGFVNVEVNAFDNIAIDHVEFIINGEQIFIDTTSPYIYNWDTTNEDEDQNQIINIDVIDHAGNETSLYPVSVIVNNLEEPDLTAPNIVIYDPASNQTVYGIVNILTIVTDNDSIDRVEFYQNYNLAYTDYSPSYTHSWNTLNEQDDTEHIWYAIAYDLENNSSQTDPILIYVDNIDNIPPYGEITYPYAGQYVNGIIDIQTEVYDNTGISQVQFLINDSIVFIDNENPFEFEWNTLPYSEDEEHLIKIIVSDIDNNNFQNGVSVTVNNNPFPDDDNIYPFASILNPVSGQSISDTISVLGFAIDNHQVEQVQFLINNEIVSTLNDTPYTFQWSTVDLEDNSEHVLIMTAEDQAGNITTAQPVLVNILNP